LYAESLDTALAVHLLRQYDTSSRARVIYKLPVSPEKIPCSAY
jgi:hypothetical protein